MATFTPPPTAPNSGNPLTFNSDADAFLGWFQTFVSQLNAAGYPTIPLLSADGTAAAPSISFSSDGDTGMYRIGNDILGFAAGGAERLRITTSGAQLTGLLSGTAVTQSQVDTTSGRLLKVGDFGLGVSTGATPLLTNIDDMTVPTGFYSANSSAIGTFPAGGAAASIILIERYAGGWMRQTLTYRGDVSIYGGRSYIRVSTSTTAWGPWIENLTSRGALDATYAVDTGAANAYVVTLASAPTAYTDGMMISFRAINTNTGASTINVNGLGAKSITANGGAALMAGQIVAGAQYTVSYSTAAGNFLLISETAGANPGTLRGNVAVSAATTLTTAQLGSQVVLSGSTTYAVTLPAPSLSPGGTFRLYNSGSVAMTITTPSGTLVGSNAAGGTSLSIAAGGQVMLVSTGTAWIVSGDVTLGNMAQMAPRYRISYDTTLNRTTLAGFTNVLTAYGSMISNGSINMMAYNISSSYPGSFLYEMTVYAPAAVTVNIYSVVSDDATYVFVNGTQVVGLISSALNAGNFALNLAAGTNLIQILTNNNGNAQTNCVILADFFRQQPSLIYVPM